MIGREKRVLLRHYLEQGVPKAAIARHVGVSRETIYRWIATGQLDRELDDEAVRYRPRAPAPSKLDPYKGIIDTRLADYPRLSAVRLFNEVQAAGYRGGYGQVKRYVRGVRPQEPVEPVRRFETPPGHQGQVDFADFRLPWGKRHALIVVLGVAWRAVRSSTVWADGIYVKAGLERDKAALLVVLGAMRDGTKEVLALRSGYRESVESCSEVLRDLKARGIEAPRLLMADGNAAIWGAVRQVWPEAGEQRCWNHKMRNVLDRLPQREQSEAKDLLRTVVYAPSRAEALKAREAFARRYRPWYPKAVDVLEDDGERMVAFYDFPEDHWKHLRTTNVVESPFAALRLRTTAAKRFKRVESATALIRKLLLVAEKRFRRLDAPHLLKDVFEGRKFEDGKPVSTQQRKNAA